MKSQYRLGKDDAHSLWISCLSLILGAPLAIGIFVGACVGHENGKKIGKILYQEELIEQGIGEYYFPDPQSKKPEFRIKERK